jgi:hypothetical protein
MDTRVPQVICSRAERRMNAAFNTVSDATCTIGNINAAQVSSAARAEPGNESERQMNKAFKVASDLAW